MHNSIARPMPPYFDTSELPRIEGLTRRPRASDELASRLAVRGVFPRMQARHDWNARVDALMAKLVNGEKPTSRCRDPIVLTPCMPASSARGHPHRRPLLRPYGPVEEPSKASLPDLGRGVSVIRSYLGGQRCLLPRPPPPPEREPDGMDGTERDAGAAL